MSKIQEKIISGIKFQNENKLPEASQIFLEILQEEPNNAAAIYSLAVISLNASNPDEALRLSAHGVLVAPDYAPLKMLHGAALQALGKKKEALHSYDMALQSDPHAVSALLNSGVLLREMWHHEEAIERFNRILAIEPDNIAALGNCAILLTEFRKGELAIPMFERLLALKPDFDFGLGLLAYERLHMCDWSDFARSSQEIIQGVRAGKRVCKSLAFMALSDQAQDHQRAAQLFAEVHNPPRKKSLWQGEVYAHKKIRLAYVSPDLREHPVGHLMAGVFEQHDKSRFETIAISLGMDDHSRLRARMVAAFDQFIDVSEMGAAAIAQLMRDMEVDIAVDLGGYTSDTRTDVFAHRPAPIQVNYLGYPGTMGVDYFDYILGDRHIIPPEHRQYYNEEVVYLPNTYLPTDNSTQISPRTPSRAECGLPETGVVFCSFSHDYKITPVVFDVWMRLLQQVPGSVLWLVSRGDVAQNNLRKEAAARGVDGARLVFAGRVPLVEDHLARYGQADIFLDTYPYNAHTTAADALMAGLPVVTCMGNSFPSRVAGSVLHAINLPELVTHSLQAYEALALRLAQQPALLAELKARIAHGKTHSALFDTERFCTDLETAYQGMWDKLQSGQAVQPAPTEQASEPELQLNPSEEQAQVAELVALTRTTLPGDLGTAAELLAARNFPQAELYYRRFVRDGGQDDRAADVLAAISRGYGLDPSFRLREAVSGGGDSRYLLIKAWGYGFWSDVHHVLGQLLLAELTDRIPVVYWGSNSLFGDASVDNAFGCYFEPVSSVDLKDLPGALSIYPPKWHASNLTEENVNKWEGSFSRMAAPFFFKRPEALLVSDFYAPVGTLIPWIDPASRYYGKDEDQLYAELFAKHLRPAAPLRQRVETFYQDHMQGRHWVAVHARGSDKIYETSSLQQTNGRYFDFVDRIIQLNPGIGVFLLTDSVDLHAQYQARYGERLLTTPALRSSNDTGVHLSGHDGRTVGTEVLVDALLAIRCDYFVGNQESNVSVAIASLKPWKPGLIVIFGDKNIRSDNFFLHKQAAPVAQACRLCRAPVQRKFEKTVLGQHQVAYHQCQGCGALQTDQPFWLDQAYAGTAELYDTGKASRTVVNFLALTPLFEMLGVRKTDLAVDLGGGTGLLGRLLRDAGYNFHTCDKYGSSEFMGGYAWPDIDRPCKLITLFEVAEHFADPAAEWERIFACNPEWVIVSTGLYSGQGADWNYLSADSGQHIFFYSLESFIHIAQKYGRQAYHLGMYVLITGQALEPSTLAAVTEWRNDLYPACRQSFDAWAKNPYGHASADNEELTLYKRLALSGKRIAIDGTFFRFASGIARVWKSLLNEWASTLLASQLVIIDRGRTAPRLPGLHYVDAPLYDYGAIEQDRAMLQALCDQENVGLFISTYYTIPLTTPSALLVLDMIPEVMGYDLSNLQWVCKRMAIDYASAFLSISHSTQNDLERFYPQTQAVSKVVAHCGCDFRTASPSKVDSFKARHGIQRPYFLIAGSQDGYKNAQLFFKAFSQFGEARSSYAIVCTNANTPLSPENQLLVEGAQVHTVVLSDEELQCAYSGALALAYPSRYEGFGLPVVEAMACSCPVITTRSSSIPEVGGDAVLYVDPDDADAMFAALNEVQQSSTRQDLLDRGRHQAEQFSWTKMAREVGQRLALWCVQPTLGGAEQARGQSRQNPR